MDPADGEDYDMLDLLAYNCSTLTAQLSETKSAEEQEKLLSDYLKRVDKEFEPINELKEDLDWFNVANSLTLRGDLSGKIVVLDFFTYCCINCMHVLPDLKKLEERYSIESGLVVIGVHSAKFENEKDSANILSAIQRYNITHPVVNDVESSLWIDLHIKCWPTLLVLGPRGNPIFVLMGEGQSQTLNKYLAAAFQYYGANGALKTHPIAIDPAANAIKGSNLKFPAKINCSQSGDLYAVSDSGNNRILVFESSGKVIEKVGGKEIGFADGSFTDARFNSPQGVSFYGDDIIYVADTENHAIREINLTTKTVDTIAGHGKQGVDQTGGLIGTSQEISSPWDVVTYRTRDMDMSFHVDDSAIPERDIILIAMAGTHQIWAIFKDETIWWKFKKFSEGAVAAIAGNGHEENRNNSYPQNAAFAQPSGLALSPKHKELYIADSESSSIRKLSLNDGKVLAVAGGDRNPLNLFAFGDVDGAQVNAKFQHPLGVAYCANDHQLYVADTYNHKIKVIDLATNKATTCKFNNSDGDLVHFNEPAGLCLSSCGNRLYICNTNDHSIEVVDLKTSTVETLQLRFDDATVKSKPLPELVTSKLVLHTSGAKVHLKFELLTKSEVKFTENAPQKWQLLSTSDRWEVTTTSGDITSKIVNSDSKNNNCQKSETIGIANVDLYAQSLKPKEPSSDTLSILFKVNLCAEKSGICFPKKFQVNLPIEYSDDGANSIDRQTWVTVNEKTAELLAGNSLIVK